MAEGYIYILLNRAFQNDHYKIGMTTKEPKERARELSAATGVRVISRYFMSRKSLTARKPSGCCINGCTSTDPPAIENFSRCP